MGPVRHSWQDDCAAPLRESDPVWLLGRIESRITALERRYAEWGSDPGTPAELKAIREALSTLERLMNETLATYGEALEPCARFQAKRIAVIPRARL